MISMLLRNYNPPLLKKQLFIMHNLQIKKRDRKLFNFPIVKRRRNNSMNIIIKKMINNKMMNKITYHNNIHFQEVVSILLQIRNNQMNKKKTRAEIIQSLAKIKSDLL
jgi:hypothetical protein